jgi:hypothetical protein
MSKYEAFSQGQILTEERVKSELDEYTRHGICRALCTRWLGRIRRDYGESPRDRLDNLSADFVRIMQEQRAYQKRKQVVGAEEALRESGRKQGLGYDMDHTMIMRKGKPMSEVRARIIDDIKCFDAAANWALELGDQGRHAIAGYCGIVRDGPFGRLTLHIFDPNFGEFWGDMQEIDGVLEDVLSRAPVYAELTEIWRTTAEK